MPKYLGQLLHHVEYRWSNWPRYVGTWLALQSTPHFLDETCMLFAGVREGPWALVTPVNPLGWEYGFEKDHNFKKNITGDLWCPVLKMSTKTLNDVYRWRRSAAMNVGDVNDAEASTGSFTSWCSEMNWWEERRFPRIEMTKNIFNCIHLKRGHEISFTSSFTSRKWKMQKRPDMAQMC